MRGEPKGDNWKGNQDYQPDKVGHNEWNDPPENCRETHVFNDAFDHEHIHTNRGMNEAEFDRHHNDHSEPNRVKAEMGDHGEDDPVAPSINRIAA
jgi:hypothetical protein